MSYSIHIVRKPNSEKPEDQISEAEWTAYIESDSDLQRVEKSTNSVDATLLPAPEDASDGQVLRWSRWGISADFPQTPLLVKIAQIAQHFGASVISDDGEVWHITEDGKVTVDPPAEATETSPPRAEEKLPLPKGIIWPYFNYDPRTDRRLIIIWLLACPPGSYIAAAEYCISNRLPMPLHEAVAALRSCQSGQPVGLPGPEDLEETCLLSERLTELGIVNRACGIGISLW